MLKRIFISLILATILIIPPKEVHAESGLNNLSGFFQNITPALSMIVNIAIAPLLGPSNVEVEFYIPEVSQLDSNGIYSLFSRFKKTNEKSQYLAEIVADETKNESDKSVLGISSSPSSTPTATPEIITPTSTPIPTSTPTPTIVVSKSVSDLLLSQINDYRSSKGKTVLTTENYTCNFALLRVSEISKDFSHDGFRNRVNSNTLPYPGYSFVAENLAYNPDYKLVVRGWIDSPGHEENLVKDALYACVAGLGRYYVFESWLP